MANIFITGSSDGLGLLAAKALIAAGHQVVLHARNEERAADTKREVPGARVLIGDLSDMQETKMLARQANEAGTFHAVIHNAGVLHANEDIKSRDGLPMTFAINSIAPYILTALIHRPERLIYMSSGMHLSGNAHVDRLSSITEGKYIPGYSDTKLHDLILALAVARKWPGTYANAVDPGWVPTKMGGSHAPGNLQQGFETQVWLAVSQDKEAKISGYYFHHKKKAASNPQAKDEEIQEKLLSICAEITGVPFPSF